MRGIDFLDGSEAVFRFFHRFKAKTLSSCFVSSLTFEYSWKEDRAQVAHVSIEFLSELGVRALLFSFHRCH